MGRRPFTFSVIFVFFFAFSCYHYQEGMILKSEKSFIRFTGNYIGVSAQIDDSEPIVMTRSSPFLYQVRPGRHTVRVYRDGKLLVERILFLDNQITMEVEVP